jgi:hypothetical protein
LGVFSAARNLQKIYYSPLARVYVGDDPSHIMGRTKKSGKRLRMFWRCHCDRQLDHFLQKHYSLDLRNFFVALFKPAEPYFKSKKNTFFAASYTGRLVFFWGFTTPSTILSLISDPKKQDQT